MLKCELSSSYPLFLIFNLVKKRLEFSGSAEELLIMPVIVVIVIVNAFGNLRRFLRGGNEEAEL